MKTNTTKFIDVTTRIKATGLVDKELLEHLSTNAQYDFQEMRNLGHATPEKDKYEYTELESVGHSANVFDLPTSDLNDRNTNIVLAALRHFQNAVAAGEDLSYLGDIVDLDALDHHEIDPLCEAINIEPEQSGWKLDTVVDNDGHLNIYVSHKDGTDVMDVGEDIGSCDEWGCRLTTRKIENDYIESEKEAV